MGGRASRSKGQRGEREFADMLSAAFPDMLRVRRNIDQAYDGGEDITPQMVPGFSIEVKRQEGLNLNAWWQQAVTQAMDRSIYDNDECVPALAYRQNHQQWRIRLPLRLLVPYARPDHTVEVYFEAFVSIIKHQQWIRYGRRI